MLSQPPWKDQTDRLKWRYAIDVYDVHLFHWILCDVFKNGYKMGAAAFAAVVVDATIKKKKTLKRTKRVCEREEERNEQKIRSSSITSEYA